MWKLEERQASQAAAQVLKEHNLWMESLRICSESMSMLGPGLSGREYHPESKVLKGSSQVVGASLSVREVLVQSLQHTPLPTLLSCSIFPQTSDS